MGGFCLFYPEDWNESGIDSTLYAVEDLKKCLEGLARHLFGVVEMRWVDTYFPFTSLRYISSIFLVTRTSVSGSVTHSQRITFVKLLAELLGILLKSFIDYPIYHTAFDSYDWMIHYNGWDLGTFRNSLG